MKIEEKKISADPEVPGEPTTTGTATVQRFQYLYAYDMTGQVEAHHFCGHQEEEEMLLNKYYKLIIGGQLAHDVENRFGRTYARKRGFGRTYARKRGNRANYKKAGD